MKNLMRSKYSIIFLILFITLIYFLQSKAIMPLVMKVLDSKFLFTEDQEEEQLGKVKNQRTGFALMNCKDVFKAEAKLADSAEFLDDKYEAWALGNRTYIIRSRVRIVDPEKGQTEKAFACKMQLTDDDETDANNWSNLGVDFNPEGSGG